MNCWRPGSGWRRTIVAALLALAAAAQCAGGEDQSANADWRDVSVAEYRHHLEQLDGVVADCGAQQSLKDPASPKGNVCDPKRVGPNDRVQWPVGAGTQRREVRYDWLRSVLSSAEKKDEQAQPSLFGATPNKKTATAPVSEILNEARQRLRDDIQQAEGTAAPNPGYAGERKTLNAVLAEKAYKGAAEVTPRERFLEWLDNQLDRFFAGLQRLGGRAPWIAWALRILLLAAILTALVWFLVRIERNSRVRITPDLEPAPGAPSAREWQLWLKDAQTAAEQGCWREAIHFLYWASIARLEQMRLWPADRARTPREYLRLVAGGDERRPSLTALTRSFERTWYGGREAEAVDFHAALEQARALGVKAE